MISTTNSTQSNILALMHHLGMFEVVDVFMFKEGSFVANDYVCVVLKINDAWLIDFYGGSYLLQVWKNKNRLF